MVFPYYTERLTPLVLALPLGMAALGLWLGSVFGVALFGSACGIFIWACLQVLRQKRGVRLYDAYLLLQGSVSGRVRRIPYGQVRGFSLTKRGGLALLYRELPAPQPDLPPQALSAALPSETPPHQRLLLTARLAQPEALRAALTERCALSSADAVPATYVLGLARRRRLRDALIVLMAILGIPLYVLILSRILNSLL
jgi:hypothetical protein